MGFDVFFDRFIVDAFPKDVQQYIENNFESFVDGSTIKKLDIPGFEFLSDFSFLGRVKRISKHLYADLLEGIRRKENLCRETPHEWIFKPIQVTLEDELQKQVQSLFEKIFGVSYANHFEDHDRKANWEPGEDKKIRCLLGQNQIENPQDDMEKMNAFRKSGEKADICFKVERQTFFAHKSVLSKNKYFKAIFDGPFKESNQKEPILLHDTGAEEFEALMNYLYTGNASLSKKSIHYLIELAELADKVDVPDLASLCNFHIKMSLSTENFFEIAAYANRHDHTELLHDCKLFHMKNSIDIDIGSEDLQPSDLVEYLAMASWLEDLTLESKIIHSIKGSLSKKTFVLYCKLARLQGNEALKDVCKRFAEENGSIFEGSDKDSEEARFQYIELR